MKPHQERAAAILKRVEKGSSGAEIGVFNGALSNELLRAGIRLLMVDNWLPASKQAASYKSTNDFHTRCDDNLALSAYERAKAVAKAHHPRGTLLRQDSAVAAQWVADQCLDFVFIDADHSYEGTTTDILAWHPKVKPGGWICGHDYGNTSEKWSFGVVPAVNDFIKRTGLELETDIAFTWFARVK